MGFHRAIYRAIKIQDLRNFELLVNDFRFQDSKSIFLLKYAIDLSNINAIKYLLSIDRFHNFIDYRKILIRAIKLGNYNVFEILVNNSYIKHYIYNNSGNSNHLLLEAAILNDRYEMIVYLLKYVNLQCLNFGIIQHLVKSQSEIIKLFINYPEIRSGELFFCLLDTDRTDVLKILLDHNIFKTISFFNMVCFQGNINQVKLYLKYINPNYNIISLIKRLLINNKYEVVKLLHQDLRIFKIIYTISDKSYLIPIISNILFQLGEKDLSINNFRDNYEFYLNLDIKSLQFKTFEKILKFSVESCL